MGFSVKKIGKSISKAGKSVSKAVKKAGSDVTSAAKKTVSNVGSVASDMHSLAKTGAGGVASAASSYAKNMAKGKFSPDELASELHATAKRTAHQAHAQVKKRAQRGMVEIAKADNQWADLMDKTKEYAGKGTGAVLGKQAGNFVKNAVGTVTDFSKYTTDLAVGNYTRAMCDIDPSACRMDMPDEKEWVAPEIKKAERNKMVRSTLSGGEQRAADLGGKEKAIAAQTKSIGSSKEMIAKGNKKKALS